MGEYSRFADDTFESIAFNAGILVKNFDPTTGVASNIIGSTNSGFNFTDTKSIIDYGEDIDGCPKNVQELQKEDVDERDIHGTGTFVSVNATRMKALMAGADSTTTSDITKLTPRELAQSDFEDAIWFISDYGQYNVGAGTAGYVAIKMKNILNVGGFSIQTTNKQKAQFAFDFKAHRKMANYKDIPYEMYIKQGSASQQPAVTLAPQEATIAVDGTVTLTATTVPASATVTWASSNESVATVSNGVVTGEGAGNCIITASITQSGVTYTSTTTIIVTAS